MRVRNYNLVRKQQTGVAYHSEEGVKANSQTWTWVSGKWTFIYEGNLIIAGTVFMFTAGDTRPHGKPDLPSGWHRFGDERPNLGLIVWVNDETSPVYLHGGDNSDSSLYWSRPFAPDLDPPKDTDIWKEVTR